MQGVNCLQDLKKKLAEAGFKITKSCGWYLTTTHGRWTMVDSVVFLNNQIIKNITEISIKKKLK